MPNSSGDCEVPTQHAKSVPRAALLTHTGDLQVAALFGPHDATARLKPFAFMVEYRKDEVSIQPQSLERNLTPN